MTKNIYWILINYNNVQEIHILIKNYSFKCNFIIVDNSLNYFRLYDEIILSPGKNLGYIGGFIFSMKNYKIPIISRVIFSNSDIRIKSDIKNLFYHDSIHSKVEIPKIISNYVDQNPHMVERKKKSYWLIRKIASQNSFFWKIWLLLSFIKKKIKGKSIKKNIKTMYAGHGSFLIFNNIDFSDFIDVKYNFLYGEEIHFAEFFYINKVPVLFNENIIVLHDEHISTSKLNNKYKRELFNQSFNYIVKNYYK